jgi:hypothetical protein
MTAGPPTQPFVVVTSDIYERGAEFNRQDMATTLWMANWPDGLTVRDTTDNWRYTVRSYRNGGSHNGAEHQRLEAIGGYRWLVPASNGNLRVVYPEARYAVSDKRGYHVPRVYHVTRDGVRALCGWRICGAVLDAPPSGARECRNCAANMWRCVP